MRIPRGTVAPMKHGSLRRRPSVAWGAGHTSPNRVWFLSGGVVKD